MSAPKPVLLLILDGWGHRVETENNAIALARCPNWRRLLATCPHDLVDTHGLHVGLPDDQMGNSEVGHMNIGAGRIVYQDLTRIDQDVATGEFLNNAALLKACAAARAGSGTLHVFGLVSPGGVHSHENHIFALLDLAARQQVPRIAVHAFLDGRDMPPKSAEPSLRALEAKCAALPGAFAFDKGATMRDLLNLAEPLPTADLNRVKYDSKLRQGQRIVVKKLRTKGTKGP